MLLWREHLNDVQEVQKKWLAIPWGMQIPVVDRMSRKVFGS